VTPSAALRFVERHGIVLQAARGPVPSLAEAVAGERIRGSWWGHPRGGEIFRLAGAVCDSGDVLVCRLVEGKITYVHRRLWPALVRLASRLPAGALDAVEEEHTAAGRHRTRLTRFPRWVPSAVRTAARGLPEEEARRQLAFLFGASETPAEVARGIERRVAALRSPTTASVRAVRRQLSGELREAAPRRVLEVARALVDRGPFNLRFVAYELVLHHPGALAAVGPAELAWLGRGLADWPSVDTFALYVAGPAWRERQVPDRVIEGWTRSKDRWRRRAALVCTVALNNRARGGRGDTRRTLGICRRLIDDREDMVVKGMSWALRELGKRDPAAVQQLLDKERKLAARARLEVHRKLTTGRKGPRPRAGRVRQSVL
jgi:DNA alkylation repair enzyme